MGQEPEQTGQAPSGTKHTQTLSWGNGCAMCPESAHRAWMGSTSSQIPKSRFWLPFFLCPSSLGFIGNSVGLMVPVPLEQRSHWLWEATWCQEFSCFLFCHRGHKPLPGCPLRALKGILRPLCNR